MKRKAFEPLVRDYESKLEAALRALEAQEALRKDLETRLRLIDARPPAFPSASFCAPQQNESPPATPTKSFRQLDQSFHSVQAPRPSSMRKLSIGQGCMQCQSLARDNQQLLNELTFMQQSKLEVQQLKDITKLYQDEIRRLNAEIEKAKAKREQQQADRDKIRSLAKQLVMELAAQGTNSRVDDLSLLLARMLDAGQGAQSLLKERIRSRPRTFSLARR